MSLPYNETMQETVRLLHFADLVRATLIDYAKTSNPDLLCKENLHKIYEEASQIVADIAGGE